MVLFNGLFLQTEGGAFQIALHGRAVQREMVVNM